MKKLITLAILAITLNCKSQEILPLIASPSGDTSASVMETDVYKVIPQTGDATSEVLYFYRGIKKSLLISTEDSLFSTWGSRLLEGVGGIDFVINVDNVRGIVPLTDSTSLLFYNEGNLEKKYNLSISVGDFNSLVNGL